MTGDADGHRLAQLLARGLGAHEIARLLAARIETLAPELLSNGHRDGNSWRVGSITNEKGTSLALALNGSRRGLWIDHGDTSQAGDALDLIAKARCGGDLSAAILWAAIWLGLTEGTPVPARPPEPEADGADANAEAAKKRARAKALWLNAQPKLLGTPAGAYLDGRGQLLSGLPRQPASLRYEPQLWNAESGQMWPALLAAVNGPGDDHGFVHYATHRIWLASDGRGGWTKAPLRDPKKILGAFKGGHVAIWRGRSGKPLRDAPTGDRCVIGEGIETSLAIAQLTPELRVVAAVSLGNMAAIGLPPTIAEVVLAPDNDDRNAAASAANKHAVDAAIRRFRGEGRIVRLARPKTPGADWLDVLTGRAPE